MENANFYTPYGWMGQNYNLNLSTKEIAEKVREYAKKTYPEYKFSIRSHYFSGGSEISVTLTGGPIECPVVNTDGSLYTEKYGIQIHGSFSKDDDRIVEAVRPILNDVFGYLNSYRFSDCDGQIDYFNTNFWITGGVNGKEEWKVSSPKPQRAQKTKKVEITEVPAHEAVRVVRYSDKCFAIVGDTKPIKEVLKNMGGRFNRSLTIDGEKVSGWVIPSSKFSIETLEDVLS